MKISNWPDYYTCDCGFTALSQEWVDCEWEREGCPDCDCYSFEDNMTQEQKQLYEQRQQLRQQKAARDIKEQEQKMWQKQQQEADSEQ